MHFFAVSENKDRDLANASRSYLAALLLASHPKSDIDGVDVHLYGMGGQSETTVRLDRGGLSEKTEFETVLKCFEDNLSEIIPLSMDIGSAMLKNSYHDYKDSWRFQLERKKERHFDFIFKGNYPKEMPEAAENLFNGFLKPMSERFKAASE